MIPQIGESSFVPRLLQHLEDDIVRSERHSEWRIHPGIFSTFLLDQIVQGGGVVIDVEVASRNRSERGRGSGTGKSGVDERYDRIAKHVRTISEGIFGLRTHFLHLSSSSNPRDLPYLFFAHALAHWPARTNSNLQHDHNHHHHHQQQNYAPTTGSAASPILGDNGFGGASTSLPGQLARNRNSSRLSQSFTASINNNQEQDSLPGSPGGAFRSKRSTPTPNLTPKSSVPLLSPLEAPTLVQSPEEELSSPLQAKYDAETVVPEVLIISGLENANQAVWVKLVDILVKGYLETALDKENGEGGLKSALLGTQERRWDLPKGFTVVWVREEDKAERCPGWLVDRFACNTTVHPDDVEEAPRLPRGELLPSTLLSNLRTLIPYIHIHPPLQIHTSNLLSAISSHPRLHSSITSRASLLYPKLVRAHRLLSAPLDLPKGWDSGLERRRKMERGEEVTGAEAGAPMKMSSSAAKYASSSGAGGRLGLAGGKGGVGMWDVFAGAEPSVRDLATCTLTPGVSDNAKVDGGTNGVGGAGADQEEGLDETDEPYATPVNVEAVFWTALRHRVRLREEREEVMWLLKGTAAGVSSKYGAMARRVESDEARDEGDEQRRGRKAHVKMEKDLEGGIEDAAARARRAKKEARRRGREVDGIMAELLERV